MKTTPGKRNFLPRPALVLGLLLALLPHAGEPAGPADGFSFQRLDSAVASGVRRGVYPGAVVVVGRSDTILHARGFGRLSWTGRPATPRPDSTLYDLASLTKIVATTSAALILADQARLDLDMRVVRYLPRFSHPAQAGITVRMLLDHTSGLRSHVEFFRRSDNKEGVIDLLMRELPSRVPGDSAVYSDLNAMLLGLVVESVSGEPLERFVTREVFLPLGMTQTGFLPPASWQSRTAAGYVEGRRTVAGTVQDRNARSLGGVAGHAGLFATARDLARYAQWWLHAGDAGETRLVSKESMQSFLERRPGAGSRLLGWDSPDSLAEFPSVFGRLLSQSAFGHTGWTGTQIWVDPREDLFVVLLTNRSLNPRVTRSIRDLRAIRARVADAAVEGARAQCLARHTQPQERLSCGQR